jgi:hypothetical protein
MTSMEVDSQSSQHVKATVTNENDKISLAAEVEPEQVHSIIFSYLIQNCYTETAKSFAESTNIKTKTIPLESITLRKSRSKLDALVFYLHFRNFGLY